MKTVKFLVFFLISLSGLSQTTIDIPEDFQSLQMGKYSIGYPKSWTVDTSRNLGLDISFRSPREDTLDHFGENMNVLFQNLKDQNYTLARLGNESEIQIKSIMNEVSILESKMVDSSSVPFYLLKYKMRQGIFLLTMIQHFYFKDEVAYAVTFAMQTEKEKNYLPLAEKMFATFKLL